MSALSFFAPRSLPPDLAAKTRSLTCLSLLCFALADVRDGLGPFLGIFLQSHGWTPDSIGYVMTIGGLAGMAVTAPLGALADATRRKRLLLALASLGIVAALALIFLCQHPLLVGGAQIVQAVCAAAMAPTISGLTLGLAGQSHLPAQLGRNEAWNHAGNGLSAMLGGAIGYWYGVPGVFVVMSGMLLLSLYALHGCIAGFWHSPWSIIPVQMLDGVGAGILGVVTPGLAARLLNGTGHVNLGLGVIMTLQGIGASCSASYGGLVAHLLGYGPAFLALAAAPCVALGILLAGVRRLPRLHHALQPLEDS